MSVQILLSTYNGTEYLPEQLASLTRQTCAAELTLLVRDDGSTDETIRLLTSYTGLPTRVITGRNRGVIQSYMELMRAADPSAEFYMFCDQDDVWDLDKCATALRVARAHAKPTRPYLYCSRSRVTDEHLHFLGLTRPAPKGPSFANALIQNIAPGHTFLFNRCALEMALKLGDPARIVLHDSWMYLICSAYGEVDFDSQAHTSYRTHTKSTVGYAMNRPERIRLRIRNLFWIRAAHARQNTLLLEKEQGLSQPYREQLTCFTTGQSSLSTRIRCLLKHPLVHQSQMAQLVATVLFTFGAYRDKMGYSFASRGENSGIHGSLGGEARGTHSHA